MSYINYLKQLSNLKYIDIATLLNENNIKKRNNSWTAKSISNILSDTQNFKINYYNKQQ